MPSDRLVEGVKACRRGRSGRLKPNERRQVNEPSEVVDTVVVAMAKMVDVSRSGDIVWTGLEVILAKQRSGRIILRQTCAKEF